MKKAIIFILVVALILIAVPSAMFAAKPDGVGAQEVGWNLSGDVMPVPPWGLSDIPDSDTASKLIVNQPNGNTVVTLTGVMKGLNPNTTYTVFISNGYTPYTPADIRGTYVWWVNGAYSHDLIIDTQNPDGTFSGTGGYPAGVTPYLTSETIVGSFTGNQIEFTTTYSGPYNPGYSANPSGTIAATGSMSGNSPWEWHTTSGTVTLASGSTAYPGLFNSSTLPTFTFTTDETGSGSWHINLKDADFPGPGTYNLSVWINGSAGTILISDVFEVIAE